MEVFVFGEEEVGCRGFACVEREGELIADGAASLGKEKGTQ
jgi:hypothetical protein